MADTNELLRADLRRDTELVADNIEVTKFPQMVHVTVANMRSLIADADRLAQYERDLHDDIGKDRSQDTDWLRAGFLQHSAEIERLEDRIARFEHRALLRSEIDAPDRAVAWTRTPLGACYWVLKRGDRTPAPDMRPGDGMVTLVILDDQ